MIIGKDNFTNPNNKTNQVTKTVENTSLGDKKTLYHADVMSKNDMADKSFAMLEERYRNGLISLEEYTKQCNKLRKLRK